MGLGQFWPFSGLLGTDNKVQTDYLPSSLPLPYCRLTMNSLQSISNNTATVLSFDTVSGSGNGWVAPTPPVTTLVIPASGLYYVFAHDLDWQDAAITLGTGTRQFGYQLSAGATSRRMGSIIVGAGGATGNQSVQSFSAVLYLPANETLALVCKHQAGASLSVGVNDLFVQCIQLGTFPFSGTN